MGGLEPPTVYLPLKLQIRLLYQLSYTTPIMYYPKLRPYAEPNPAYDSWLFAQRAYSEPLLHLFALLKFRIPAAHSASINLPPFPRSYTTTYHNIAHPVSCRIRNLPCRLWLYLRIGYRLFHSVGLSVSFAAVSIRYTYRLAPWLLHLLSDLNKCCCLLAGFARCTTLGVRGRWWIRTTDVPDFQMSPFMVGYSSLPSSARPTFRLSLIILIFLLVLVENQRASQQTGNIMSLKIYVCVALNATLSNAYNALYINKLEWDYLQFIFNSLIFPLAIQS